MSTVDTSTTVADLVKEAPGRSRVFEDFGIDYCCGGKKPLREACRERAISTDEVVRALEAAEVDGAAEKDWSREPLEALIDHIVGTHHGFLREELPRLHTMLEKVNKAHGKGHPELERMLAVYDSLQHDLLEHMRKEEEILFPAVRQLDRAAEPPAFPFGSLATPIEAMEAEHDGSGDALSRLRELSGGFTPPADACPTYIAMLEGLRRLEEDIHRHVHKENHILFPGALEAEREKTAKARA